MIISDGLNDMYSVLVACRCVCMILLVVVPVAVR